MLIILIYFFYILSNIGLAKIDADKIKNQININHTKNTWIYIGTLLPAFALVYFKFENTIILKVIYALIICIALCALRKFVFDTALNIFRKLPSDYISKTTTSKTDQESLTIEEKIGYWPYHIIFLLVSIGLAFLKF